MRVGDGSVVKSISVPAPKGGPQPFRTLVSKDIMPSSDLCGDADMHDVKIFIHITQKQITLKIMKEWRYSDTGK